MVDLQQGWGSRRFWKLRNKLAADTDIKKNDAIDKIGNYCEENYDDLLSHIMEDKPIKKVKKFEMRF